MGGNHVMGIFWDLDALTRYLNGGEVEGDGMG